MDVPNVGPLMGLTAGLVWRGFETWSQISFRNQVRRQAGLCLLVCVHLGVMRLPGGLEAVRLPCHLAVHFLETRNLRHTLLTTPRCTLQILVATDWVRTKLFGRDTSRV